MSDKYPEPIDSSTLLKPIYDDLDDDDRVQSITVGSGHESNDIVFYITPIDDIAEFGIKSDYLGYSSNPRDNSFTEDSIITSPHDSATRNYPSFPVIIFE